MRRSVIVTVAAVVTVIASAGAAVVSPVGHAASADVLGSDTSLCSFAAADVPEVLPSSCDDRGDTVGVRINSDATLDITVGIPGPARGWSRLSRELTGPSTHWR